jgi:hypothetical protein
MHRRSFLRVALATGLRTACAEPAPGQQPGARTASETWADVERFAGGGPRVAARLGPVLDQVQAAQGTAKIVVFDATRYMTAFGDATTVHAPQLFMDFYRHTTGKVYVPPSLAPCH